jgi:hypothetical protein
MVYQLTALGMSVLTLRAVRQVAVPARKFPQFAATLDILGGNAAANARRMG